MSVFVVFFDAQVFVVYSSLYETQNSQSEDPTSKSQGFVLVHCFFLDVHVGPRRIGPT